ncbi:hypothetical protein LEP1GSC199_3468 [Leptospira vanthielii serovar Holland str. Waz Holland = ATCC 700522]|uniref:Uncharacterized protein n=2 Tax=Leptospira vanthielii TaxID=293085 RepID=N1W7D0_9LEPT|nr:hypothetical protein LEP1GSC199_3468 [Leptospira vanthielii serovar Holland str. Waz Holland = ATCC 700522]
MKGVIDETEKSITLHINNPMHPFILPTYTTENTTSIVYTHALPQLIEFQPDQESVRLTYMEGRQLSSELTLISPTGTAVNYKIYTMMLNASTDPRTSNSWHFVSAKFNPTDFIDHINNAEYSAKVSVRQNRSSRL